MPASPVISSGERLARRVGTPEGARQLGRALFPIRGYILSVGAWFAAQAGSEAAHRQRGQVRAGNLLAAKLPRLQAECEDHWPGWHPAPRGPAVLTGREREVCELAAGGLENQAIARSLVLSVRTVENHLQRAYSKLGVRGRAELSVLLAART